MADRIISGSLSDIPIHIAYRTGFFKFFIENT